MDELHVLVDAQLEQVRQQADVLPQQEGAVGFRVADRGVVEIRPGCRRGG